MNTHHNNIKIAHEVLNYFKFKITSRIVGEQLKLKLVRLCQLNGLDDKIKIILDFVDGFKNDEIELVIDEIRKIISNNNLNRVILYAVAKTSSLAVHSISGIPVIDILDSSINNSRNIENNKTLIVTDPVRSGMKITHDGDVVVTNFVSNNAEVISCGNIHIYDLAKGRLIAGSSGDRHARVFVMKFDAQLIAIGGVYRIIDTELPINILNKPVMIYLDDKDKLNLVPLKN